jgi:hypothetical protein
VLRWLDNKQIFSEEILAVEKKFNKLRKPLYSKRQEMIRKMDTQNNIMFWWESFQKHPMLFPMLSEQGKRGDIFSGGIFSPEKKSEKLAFVYLSLFFLRQNSV